MQVRSRFIVRVDNDGINSSTCASLALRFPLTGTAMRSLPRSNCHRLLPK